MESTSSAHLAHGSPTHEHVPNATTEQSSHGTDGAAYVQHGSYGHHDPRASVYNINEPSTNTVQQHSQLPQQPAQPAHDSRMPGFINYGFGSTSPFGTPSGHATSYAQQRTWQPSQQVSRVRHWMPDALSPLPTSLLHTEAAHPVRRSHDATR